MREKNLEKERGREEDRGEGGRERGREGEGGKRTEGKEGGIGGGTKRKKVGGNTYQGAVEREEDLNLVKGGHKHNLQYQQEGQDQCCGHHEEGKAVMNGAYSWVDTVIQNGGYQRTGRLQHPHTGEQNTWGGERLKVRCEVVLFFFC